MTIFVLSINIIAQSRAKHLFLLLSITLLEICSNKSYCDFVFVLNCALQRAFVFHLPCQPRNSSNNSVTSGDSDIHHLWEHLTKDVKMSSNNSRNPSVEFVPDMASGADDAYESHVVVINF